METSQILYWRGSGEVRADILLALSNLGYQIISESSFEQVLEIVDAESIELIIVDASGGETDASNRVVELSGAETLQPIPVIFLSYQAARRADILSKEYRSFFPIDAPFQLSKLLEKIGSIVPPPARVHLESDTPVSPPKAKPGKISSIYRIRAVAERDPTKLRGSYGGEMLHSGSSFEAFDDEALLPEHPQREVFDEILRNTIGHSDWLALHSRRSSFVGSAMAASLGLSEQQNSFIRSLSVGLQSGLLEASSSLVTSDPFTMELQSDISELVNCYLRSAEIIEERTDDQIVSQGIREVAKLLSGESKGSSLEEQIVLASDLINRTTWPMAVWDHFGNHRALRRMKENFPTTFHPKILGVTARLLAEAAALSDLSQAEGSLPEEAQEAHRASILRAKRDALTRFGEHGHLSIKIADLKPGMLLVRPLVSWDGRLILESNISLDQELIERLWRLATIRPFQSPVLVAQSGE